jgi:hypothetical protein
MEKEFTPYEQALALKELGFDEPCFKGYTEEYKTLISFSNTHTNTSVKNTLPTKPFTAPLYQQAFRWFREKYNLCGEVYTVNMGAIDYTFLIRDLYSEDVKYDNFEANTGGYSGTFNTYEESELECLKKLIEIVEKQKKDESKITV